jgi:hypothetical protein
VTAGVPVEPAWPGAAQRLSGLERYQQDREKILGQHRQLHVDPVIAAGKLATALGGKTAAHSWLTSALKALNEGGRR